MKIAYSWLCEYIAPTHNQTLPEASEAASMLTHCGLEVESIETFESVKGGLQGLVIGQVIEKRPHPDADKLCITRVDTGHGRVLQIVCGAPNVEAGQKVLVAVPGTTIHSWTGDTLSIKKSKIRGQESEGMICAEDEAGLGASHDGILILSPNAVTGTPAADYFNVFTEPVFEIGLTPNRADAASHVGVARDLVAVLNYKLGKQAFKLNLPGIDAFKIDNDNLAIGVKVENTDACPRYSGVTMTHVQTGDSPAWLQQRLRSVGLTPINNVVDITNYVMHETGQPLHAFDADRIAGKQVIVKNLPAGTSFVTLDEVKRTLTGKELMICDRDQGMCIAGVYGGSGTGISSSTRNVFLESAKFNPVAIRHAARHHGLHTEASFRFERGTDESMTLYALRRAALLIGNECNGQVSSDIVDIYHNPAPKTRILFHYEKASRLAGIVIDAAESKGIFRDLGIAVVNDNGHAAELELPGHKADMKYDADLTEEILRIGGYDRITTPHGMRMPMPSAYVTEPIASRCAPFLVAHGFFEILTNSLEKMNDDPSEENRPVRLLNPSSADLNSMRRSLLPSCLDAVAYNYNRKRPDLRFFQTGKTYRYESAVIHEQEEMCLAVSGRRTPQSWIGHLPETYDIFYLKTLVASLLNYCGIAEDRLQFTTAEDETLTDVLAVSSGNTRLGLLGSVRGGVLKNKGVAVPVFYVSLLSEAIARFASQAGRQFAEAPRFPEVRRDLSMIIPPGVTYEMVERLAYSTEKKLLKKVSLFDVYSGDRIGSGNVSYALHFIMQNDERTMTEKEIDRVMKRLSEAFESKLGARLRT